MNVCADYQNDGTDLSLPIQKAMSYSQAPKPEYTAAKHLEEQKKVCGMVCVLQLTYKHKNSGEWSALTLQETRPNRRTVFHKCLNLLRCFFFS